MGRIRLTEKIANSRSITARLDLIASELEQADPSLALAIDQISDHLEGRKALFGIGESFPTEVLKQKGYEFVERNADPDSDDPSDPYFDKKVAASQFISTLKDLSNILSKMKLFSAGLRFIYEDVADKGKEAQLKSILKKHGASFKTSSDIVDASIHGGTVNSLTAIAQKVIAETKEFPIWQKNYGLRFNAWYKKSVVKGKNMTGVGVWAK